MSASGHQRADLHCVSGWSATSLRWEGIPFAAFYLPAGVVRVVYAPLRRPIRWLSGRGSAG